MPDRVWRYESFARLAVVELYAIVSLRERVFIVEQSCPYLDSDDIDPISDHLWTEETGLRQRSAPPAVLAYLRVVPPRAKFAEPSLGRVVVAPEARRRGLGRALMKEGLARAHAAFGDVPIRIGAQKYLERFYGALGFVRASDDYVEDGILHLEMLHGL